jgi:tetratricopeptide (TPR) repeat protein
VIDPSLESLKTATLDIPIHHHMDDDPSKPKKDRQLNYLRIIEKELAQCPDGRLSAAAGGVCMYHAHDYHKAIEYFRQAADLGFRVDSNLENLAEAHYRLEQWDESGDIYARLLQSGYATFSSCNNLANLMVKKGNFSRAAELLRMALSLGEPDGDIAARLEQNIRYLESQVDTTGQG